MDPRVGYARARLTAEMRAREILVAARDDLPAVVTIDELGVKFVVDAGVARNFGDGPMRRTEAPFDVAIEGRGFFKISTAEGERYTRDGHFRTDETGKASAVQFLHFPFTAAQVAKFRRPGAQVTLGFAHANYAHSTVLSDAVRGVLAEDFE